MRDETELQMRIWWIDEIKDITKKVLMQEEKRQDRERSKVEKRLGEYRTYNDIQDAYGCGVITEKQFDRLADLLEKANPVPSALYHAKIDLLQELYQEQKELIEKLRQRKESGGYWS